MPQVRNHVDARRRSIGEQDCVMMQNVYQCCYTNAASGVGGIVSSGWRPVAYSEGIPKDAMDECVRFQKGNSNIRQNMVDEDGNDLNLLEIAGDGAYLYVMRTQYGLKDVRGRRNMFSHAYCFPWSKELLDDPNKFLTIDRSNFAISEEEALVEKSEFKRMSPFNAETARAAAGIETSEELASLIGAVYEQMTNQSVFEPLYVQYDGTNEQLVAFLYCIYTFLPPHFRRSLVSASAEGNNASLTNVVFSRNASKHRFFFDSNRNTGNVLTPARRSAIKRLGFVDYAALNVGKIDPQSYFEDLEQRVADFSISSTSVAQITLAYKIAHQLIVRPVVKDYSDVELDRSVGEALRLRTNGSGSLDAYLVDLFEQMTLRKLMLIDGLDRYLDDRVRVPHSDALDKAVEQYNMFAFEQLSIDDAARKLHAMDGKTFQKYFNALKRTEKGEEILNAYLVSLLSNPERVTWETLEDCAKKAKLLSHGQKAEDAVQRCAWELYHASLGKVADVPDSLERYLGVMRDLTPSEDMRNHKTVALEEFWREVDESSPDFQSLDVYRCMDDGSEKARRVLDTLDVYDAFANGTEEEFLRKFHGYCVKNRLWSRGEDRDGVTRWLAAAVSGAYGGGDAHLVDWMRVVSLLPNEWAFGELLATRATLLRKNYDELPSRMEALSVAITGSDNWSKVLRNALNLVRNICVEKDRGGGEPVSLDVWLTLGKLHPDYSNKFGGPFTIFDMSYRPQVLQMNPIAVVERSRLMIQLDNIAYAEQYFERLKGSGRAECIEAEAVDSWCRAAKKPHGTSGEIGRIAADEVPAGDSEETSRRNVSKPRRGSKNSRGVKRGSKDVGRKVKGGAVANHRPSVKSGSSRGASQANRETTDNVAGRADRDSLNGVPRVGSEAFGAREPLRDTSSARNRRQTPQTPQVLQPLRTPQTQQLPQVQQVSQTQQSLQPLQTQQASQTLQSPQMQQTPLKEEIGNFLKDLGSIFIKALDKIRGKR